MRTAHKQVMMIIIIFVSPEEQATLMKLYSLMSTHVLIDGLKRMFSLFFCPVAFNFLCMQPGLGVSLC